LIEALALSRDHDAGTPGGRLAEVERERDRLLADRSEFDRLDGDMTIGEFTRRASKSKAWCRFLHLLTYRLQPLTVVEMGTGVGISGASIATALPDGSSMWTIDLRVVSGRLAREVFQRVGVDVQIVTGRFDEVFDQVLVESRPLDLLYVDGHHNEQATLAYTEQAVPYLSDRALVVYDDIRWSDGMERAWANLQSQSRWLFTADVGEMGACAV
jgi:predicted O-methyltransferase YrrM